VLEGILIIGPAVLNGTLARRKGKNPLVWGLVSLAAFFVTLMILGGIYIAVTYQGPLEQQALEAYQQAFVQNPINGLLLLLFGVGGELLVHYYLSRRPDVKPDDSTSDD
jgi:hypothetical protein